MSIHSLKSKRSDTVLIPLLFVSFLITYVYTLLPTVAFYGDTPRFQTTPAIWGLNNPPGAPLQIFLGRLFLLLPFGDAAYRIDTITQVEDDVTLA